MISQVLLVRINGYGELLHTRGAVDVIRKAFPGAAVTALATPQSEGLSLLEADDRLDHILLFPPADTGPTRKSPRAFHAFMAQQKFDATVLCYGSIPGINYSAHVFSLLLCPGRKYVLDRHGRLFPLVSGAGAGAFAVAVESNLQRLLTKAGALALRRRRLVRPDDETPLLRAEQNCPRRILWIRLNGLGDATMTLPALHALKAQFPDAAIDVLVRPVSAPLMQTLPEVREVIAFETTDSPLTTRAQTDGQASLLRLAGRLRRTRYDLAIDIAGWNSARIAAFLSGARLTVSPAQSIYDATGAQDYSFLMTHPVALDDARARSASANFLRLLQILGVDTPEAPYRLPVTEQHWQDVRAKIDGLGVTRPYAILHGRSADEAKDWRAERFAAVADYLMETHGLDVLLTGAPRDQEFNANVRREARLGERIRDATGAFALAELPALCEQARLMVTVDTGPMHIAAMVGTPLVALFLPWFIQRDQPYGQPDTVLTPFSGMTFPAERAAEFWQGQLLDGITVEQVIAAVDRKLEA